MAACSRLSSPGVSPSMKKPDSIVIKGFKVTTQKLPILKADPIEAMTKKLGIALPEMIFGDNYVSIEHEASGWGISFNALDALDRVDKTGESMLRVAHSKEWQKSRFVDIVLLHHLVFVQQPGICDADNMNKGENPRWDKPGYQAVRLVLQHRLCWYAASIG